MTRPTHLPCPFDGGPLPVILAVPDGLGLTMLYTYCPWCHAMVATAVEDTLAELHEVAVLAYDSHTEAYSPWGEQPSVPEAWREFALRHLPS